MILYLVRHAIAYERDAGKWPDDSRRPLTGKGEAKFRKIAGVVREMSITVDACLSSPYVRAWRTAEILNEEAAWPAPAEFPALEPGGTPAGVVKVLAKHKGDTMGLVGHEPSLSELLAHLLVGSGAEVLGGMKKGGIACVEFEARPAAGSGSLLWLATPKLFLQRS